MENISNNILSDTIITDSSKVDTLINKEKDSDALKYWNESSMLNYSINNSKILDKEEIEVPKNYLDTLQPEVVKLTREPNLKCRNKIDYSDMNNMM